MVSALLARGVSQFWVNKYRKTGKARHSRLSSKQISLRFARKSILCALGLSDLGKAREIYYRMSDSNKKDPSTQYLVYKVALRCRDLDLGMQTLDLLKDCWVKLIPVATECLDAISNASMKDATLLYACVLEAQKTGEPSQIIASLQRVLQKYNYNAPSEVHLPALLRFVGIDL